MLRSANRSVTWVQEWKLERKDLLALQDELLG